MNRRFLLYGLAVIALGAAAPSEVFGQYTVYKYNLRRNDGWYRTGTAGVPPSYYPSVYTSWNNCVGSIRERLAENNRYGTAFEVYIIVYSPRRDWVPDGRLVPRQGMRYYGYYGARTFGPHARMGYY